MAPRSSKKWLPLESNPEVIASFAHTLGLPADIGFHDVFGFEPDLLAMVPQPVHAVLLLFPITDTSEKARADEAVRIEREGQTVSKDVYYTRQTIGNACGTIGVLHAVGNNLHQYPEMPKECYFSEFFQNTKAMTPDERAAYLENDDSLETAHAGAVAAGETACPTLEEDINLHFVALVHVDGGLYELDGRKQTPVYHGVTSSETLLQDSVPVIQEFIKNAEGNVNFNAIAMAPGSAW
jgi:ubiquitin carboxyl-terminal hydrolase L3